MRTTIMLAALIAVAGCSEPKQNVPEVEKSDHEATTNTPGIANDTPAMIANESAAAETVTEIPAALRGRWGLGPNDCDPAQDFAAKGLVVIDATTLKYYESRGKLGAVRAAGDAQIDADFAFTGEGQTWTRQIRFTRERDTLTAVERGEGGAPAPLVYTKCAA